MKEESLLRCCSKTLTSQMIEWHSASLVSTCQDGSSINLRCPSSRGCSSRIVPIRSQLLSLYHHYPAIKRVNRVKTFLADQGEIEALGVLWYSKDANGKTIQYLCFFLSLLSVVRLVVSLSIEADEDSEDVLIFLDLFLRASLVCWQQPISVQRRWERERARAREREKEKTQ